MALLVAIVLSAGCARYEYELVRPPELGRRIGSKVDQVVTLDPLEYRFRTADSRLVIRIHNPTDEPITLRGDQSFVVDPRGQSYPLRSQTIAPGSFIKLILPPMRPYYPRGPTFGVGVGVGVHRFHDEGEPRYYSADGGADPVYWEWSGAGGEVRLKLVYRRDEKTFSDPFVFRRIKL